MADLVVRSLSRRYGSFDAVKNVDLQVNDGEFLTLLGPSGCGKSTTLAMLAGLDRPSSGFISVGESIFFDDASGKYVEAERRDLGLVFQTYALWPHMTVRDNIAYALKIRRMPRIERERRIHESLALVEMEEFAERYPNQLSGGQQQRVALARTLAYRPKLLLLDEPLSNLDAKLRDKARSWLKQLQVQIGITTVFVTHDQTEALALSDRIAVMQKGEVIQFGSPKEIYQQPATPFIADFIGSSNFFSGTVERADSMSTAIRLSDGQLIRALPSTNVQIHDRAVVVCRPERITISESMNADRNVIRSTIVDRNYLGSRTLFTLRAGRNTFRVEHLDDIPAEELLVELPTEHCLVFRDDGKVASQLEPTA